MLQVSDARWTVWVAWPINKKDNPRGFVPFLWSIRMQKAGR